MNRNKTKQAILKDWIEFITPINGNDEGTSLTPQGIADWWLNALDQVRQETWEEVYIEWRDSLNSVSFLEYLNSQLKAGGTK